MNYALCVQSVSEHVYELFPTVFYSLNGLIAVIPDEPFSVPATPSLLLAATIQVHLVYVGDDAIPLKAFTSTVETEGLLPRSAAFPVSVTAVRELLLRLVALLLVI